MLVGHDPSVAHQMFVQIGFIRRPDQDSKLHVFAAWQGTSSQITYRQIGTIADGPHRFAIAEDGDAFLLMADGRTIAVVDLPELAQAAGAYVEIGPEVYAEGDALSGSVLYAAINEGEGWTSLQSAGLCRYENHGTMLRYSDGQWNAGGRFDRRLSSAFHGSCAGI